MVYKIDNRWHNKDTIGGLHMKKMMIIVAAAAVTTSIISTDASATTTANMKIKQGKLINKWTGKTIKGYKVYNKKLYKNGVLTKGRVKYGKGAAMKLYRNGVLEKGIVVTKNQAYIFKNGTLIKGTYTYELKPGKVIIFKNGMRTNTLEVKNNRLYDNGKLKKGTYVINAYEYDEGDPIDRYPMLFVDGKLSTKTMFATYNGQRYLFKDGVFATTYYKGKVYEQGLVAKLNTFTSIYNEDGVETLYYNGALYTGVYAKDGDIEWYYENGQMKMTTTLQQFITLLNDVLASEDATQFSVSVGPLLAKFDEDPVAIRRSSEQGADEQIDGAKRVAAQLKQVGDLAATFEKAAIADDVETRIQNLYASLNRIYENGALRDGIYDGVVYRDGERISSLTLQQLSEADMAYYEDKGFDEAVRMKDAEKIKQALPTHIALLTAKIDALRIALQDEKAKEDSAYSYYESTAKETLEIAMSDREKMIDAMTTYDFEADVSALNTALEQAYSIISNENIQFETVTP